VPTELIWACLAEVAERSLGRKTETVTRNDEITTPPPIKPLTAPPPEMIAQPASAPVASPRIGPNIPAPAVTPAGTGTQSLADVVAELESEQARDDRPSRVRTPTSQRFRPAATGPGVGRLATSRRPQAQANPSDSRRRDKTDLEELDLETETSVKGDEWRAAPGDDEQLVDWQASEETVTGADELNDRKR
jgi:hypothetical protein